MPRRVFKGKVFALASSRVRRCRAGRSLGASLRLCFSRVARFGGLPCARRGCARRSSPALCGRGSVPPLPPRSGGGFLLFARWAAVACLRGSVPPPFFAQLRRCGASRAARPLSRCSAAAPRAFAASAALSSPSLGAAACGGCSGCGAPSRSRFALALLRAPFGRAQPAAGSAAPCAG